MAGVSPRFGVAAKCLAKGPADAPAGRSHSPLAYHTARQAQSTWHRHSTRGRTGLAQVQRGARTKPRDAARGRSPQSGRLPHPPPQSRAVTPTEPNVHGDALCFMVKTWARHKTTETGWNNGWRLAAVGGGWRRLAAVGGGWRLVVGGWRWAPVGGWRLVVLRGGP